jgi:hypothetical protein
MKSVLPIVAMLITAVSTLTAVVCCLAMGANASPAQIRALKLWMGGLTLLGLAGIVVAIVLLRGGQHGWATIAAAAPTAFIGIVTIIAFLK